MKSVKVLLVSATLCVAAGTASAAIVDLTVDRKGTVALGGTLVLVSGTITCNSTPGTIVSFTSLSGTVVQFSVGGKVFSQGSFFASPQCLGDGTPIPFTAQLSTGGFGTSPFKPGGAEVSLFASQFECDVNFSCSTTTKSEQAKITLNP